MRVAASQPVLHFALLAATVLAASGWAVSSPAFARNGDAMALALTLDLTVFAPAAFWLLVVRRRAASPAAVAAVFLAGLSAARALLPPEGQAWPDRMALLALPAEALLAALLARKAVRLRRGLSARRRDLPFEEALPATVSEALGEGQVARALSAELLVLYFALFAWRRRPSAGWSHHFCAGWSAMVAALSLAIVAEALALHFLVRLASPGAAWLLTGLSAYSLIWLLGDWRALALRRTAIVDGVLRVRVGLRWQADVPLAAIRTLRPFSPGDAGRSGYLRMRVLGSPTHLLELYAPLEIRGPLGRRATARALGLQLDGPGLAEAVAESRVALFP